MHVLPPTKTGGSMSESADEGLGVELSTRLSGVAFLRQYDLREVLGISVLFVFSTDTLQGCLRLRAASLQNIIHFPENT